MFPDLVTGWVTDLGAAPEADLGAAGRVCEGAGRLPEGLTGLLEETLAEDVVFVFSDPVLPEVSPVLSAGLVTLLSFDLAASLSFAVSLFFVLLSSMSLSFLLLISFSFLLFSISLLAVVSFSEFPFLDFVAVLSLPDVDELGVWA